MYPGLLALGFPRDGEAKAMGNPQHADTAGGSGSMVGAADVIVVPQKHGQTYFLLNLVHLAAAFFLVFTAFSGIQVSHAANIAVQLGCRVRAARCVPRKGRGARSWWHLVYRVPVRSHVVYWSW